MPNGQIVGVRSGGYGVERDLDQCRLDRGGPSVSFGHDPQCRSGRHSPACWWMVEDGRNGR
jgi:hypothetical protein